MSGALGLLLHSIILLQCPGITLCLHLCHCWHCAALAEQVSSAKNLSQGKKMFHNSRDIV